MSAVTSVNDSYGALRLSQKGRLHPLRPDREARLKVSPLESAVCSEASLNSPSESRSLQPFRAHRKGRRTSYFGATVSRYPNKWKGMEMPVWLKDLT